MQNPPRGLSQQCNGSTSQNGGHEAPQQAELAYAPGLSPGLSSTSLANSDTAAGFSAAAEVTDAGVSNGTSAWDERWNLALLVLLYHMQGIPLGLTLGSLPFILQSKLSYTQMGIFSMAAYPYSLKLLWSPVVDSCYSLRMGRRKSWIIPMQFAIAWMLISWAGWIQRKTEEADVNSLTLLFFVFVFVVATQDIAVDGWALTLLPTEHVGYASTCQTIGTSCGYFTSFTIFLALQNPDFCNKYLRGPAGLPWSDCGMVTLAGYLQFWGWTFACITLLVALFKTEINFSEEELQAGRKTCRRTAQMHDAADGAALALSLYGHPLSPFSDMSMDQRSRYASGNGPWRSQSVSGVPMPRPVSTSNSTAQKHLLGGGRTTSSSAISLFTRHQLAGGVHSPLKGGGLRKPVQSRSQPQLELLLQPPVQSQWQLPACTHAAQQHGLRSQQNGGVAPLSDRLGSKTGSRRQPVGSSRGAHHAAAACFQEADECEEAEAASATGTSMHTVATRTPSFAAASAAGSEVAFKPGSASVGGISGYAGGGELRYRGTTPSVHVNGSNDGRPLGSSAVDGAEEDVVDGDADQCDGDDSSGENLSLLQELGSAYAQLWGVVKLPAIWRLSAFLLTSRLGILAAEGAASLKLIDKGVAKEALALLVLLQFPVELLSALVAGRWAARASPYRPFIVGYGVRLAAAAATVALISTYTPTPPASSDLMPHASMGVMPNGTALGSARLPASDSPFNTTSAIAGAAGASAAHTQGHGGSSWPFFVTLTILGLITAASSTLSFTAIGSFFNAISDPAMGGAYLTLLNTITNMGYMLPRTPVFYAMDALTVTKCIMRSENGTSDVLLQLHCPKKAVDMRAPNECSAAGGVCSLSADGFYITAWATLLLGALLGIAYMQLLPQLMQLPLQSWRAQPPARSKRSL